MIAVIDYGGGNLFSVIKAVQSFGENVSVIETPEAFTGGKLIIPGVGAFGDAMSRLRAVGFDQFIKEQKQAGTPILGICLGMQILFAGSEETPGVEGLGFFPERIKKFSGKGKIPHMGWNQIYFTRAGKLLHGIQPGSYVYFAHSFYAPVTGGRHEAAYCDYLQRFVAVIEQDNLYAVQFHPEKSHRIGMAMLENFIRKT